MSRRGDNIHKRKDGRWEGRYKAGINECGKTKYKSVYGKTYGECKRKLEAAKLGNSCSDNNYSLSFGCVLNIWLDNRKLKIKESTFLKYQSVIQLHIEPTLGSINISSINSYIINKFLTAKLNQNSRKSKNPLSPSYVRTMAVIIEAALDYAVKEGFCQPLKNEIIKPCKSKKDITVLSPEEQINYENSLKAEASNTALGVMIVLYTGLRIGEICALHWNDIDIKNDLIHVNHTVSRVLSTDGKHKTKLVLSTPKTTASKRIIPIPSGLKTILQNVSDKNGFVVSSTDSFMDTRTFDYRFKRLLKTKALKNIHFHVLRHTFATSCLQYGMDVKTLSEILGHSSATITLNTYVHSSMKNKREQLEKVLKKCS